MACIGGEIEQLGELNAPFDREFEVSLRRLQEAV